MSRHPRTLRRWVLRILPIFAAVIALLIALFLVSGVQVEGGGASYLVDSYTWVLALTAFALLILILTIGNRIYDLYRRVRQETPGARLAARWVRNFLALSLPPALIVYAFSIYFLTSTIDNWFTVEVESALSDALELGQEFLDTRTLEVRNQLNETAASLDDVQDDPELLRQALLGRVRATGPSELSVLEEDGAVVATANIAALGALPERPGDFALLQAVERGEYAAAEPRGDGSLQIRVLVRVPGAWPSTTPRFLQAIFPLPADITDLTGSIEREYHRYQNVSYLRESLKQSFVLILSLVLLLTVLLAILAALIAARRMVSPLSRLSAATQGVAAGDFSLEVESEHRDEIGFLVSSFNEMTQALKAASQVAEESRAELQAQGDYLETVLGSLSAGVLTLDEEGLMITANDSCKNVLGLPEEFDISRPAGQALERLSALAPFLDPFVAEIRRQVERGRNEWQQEIKLERSQAPLVLLMRGSRLPGLGTVIVFDDVTVLNQAQREAAWSEVARRLAHEVKNPLTPIRLAAERLRMKLSDKLEAGDSEILNRASRRIVDQVEALRTLVDAFQDYAQEPALSRDAIRLDELIREVVSLYRDGDSAIEFELQLVPGPAGLAADAGRMRQMLHNLIRNAREAGNTAAADQSATALVTIRSELVTERGLPWLSLELLDNGPGFPQAVLDKPFEPYVTHKSGGSGLGLAICRKIVSEHDGRISIANVRSGGARVRILLPLDPSVSEAVEERQAS